MTRVISKIYKFGETLNEQLDLKMTQDKQNEWPHFQQTRVKRNALKQVQNRSEARGFYRRGDLITQNYNPLHSMYMFTSLSWHSLTSKHTVNINISSLKMNPTAPSVKGGAAVSPSPHSHKGELSPTETCLISALMLHQGADIRWRDWLWCQ